MEVPPSALKFGISPMALGSRLPGSLHPSDTTNGVQLEPQINGGTEVGGGTKRELTDVFVNEPLPTPSKIPHYYDNRGIKAYNSFTSITPFGRLEDVITRLLKQRGGRPVEVLELGAGRGNVAAWLKARFGDEIEIDNISLDPNEVYDVNRRAFRNNVGLDINKITHLPRSYDIIISIYGGSFYASSPLDVARMVVRALRVCGEAFLLLRSFREFEWEEGIQTSISAYFGSVTEALGLELSLKNFFAGDGTSRTRLLYAKRHLHGEGVEMDEVGAKANHLMQKIEAKKEEELHGKYADKGRGNLADTPEILGLERLAEAARLVSREEGLDIKIGYRIHPLSGRSDDWRGLPQKIRDAILDGLRNLKWPYASRSFGGINYDYERADFEEREIWAWVRSLITDVVYWGVPISNAVEAALKQMFPSTHP